MSRLALSMLTGTTLCGVGAFVYLQHQHPDKFHKLRNKLKSPEDKDGGSMEEKWGMFGTGISDMIPFSVEDYSDFFRKIFRDPSELREKRAQEIRELYDKEKQSDWWNSSKDDSK